MSQTPIHTAPGERVSETFNNFPDIALERRSVEPNIRILSLSDGNNDGHFPFMKLPVGMSTVAYTVSVDQELTLSFTPSEIRLKVYSYLLVATSFDTGWAELDGPASKAIGLKIYTTYPQMNCKRVGNSNDLTPQILRTCRNIHKEATPILYYENIFHFKLRYSNRPWENNATGKLRLETLCQELYHKTVESWREEPSKSPIYSDLAIFLRQIGRQNAASVRRLQLSIYEYHRTCSDAKQSGWPMEVVTQLLKYHALNIRQIKICHFINPDSEELRHKFWWSQVIDGPGVPTDDRPDLVRLEEAKALCQAIAGMVQEITWLKHLRITGFEGEGQHRQVMEDLQTLVNKRP